MKNIIYCLLVFLSFSCKGQNRKEFFLIPYQVGDKWGLSDTLGNIKVKPEYDEIIDFDIQIRQNGNVPSYSYYYVKKNKEILFIDSENKRYFKDYEIVQSRNTKTLHFKKDGKIGLQWPSMESGEWKLEGDPASYQYDNIYNYPDSNSLFTLFIINKKKGIMLEDRQIIIPAEYDSISYLKSQQKWEFKAYQLDGNKKIIQEKKYIKDFDLSPSPGFLTKVDTSGFLERKEMKEFEKKSYHLDSYKNVYYYKDFLPAIVKDNNSNKFGITYGNNNGTIEFLYDDIFTVIYHSASYKDKYKVYVFKKGNIYGMFDKSNKYAPYTNEYDSIEQRYYMMSKMGDSGSFVEMPYLVFKKKNMRGVDHAGVKLFNMIPFKYDDIIDRNIVIKNKMFGVWDNTFPRTVHIDPKYLSKPKLVKEFTFPTGKAFIYEVLNRDNQKIFVYRNGLELYKKY